MASSIRGELCPDWRGFVKRAARSPVLFVADCKDIVIAVLLSEVSQGLGSGKQCRQVGARLRLLWLLRRGILRLAAIVLALARFRFESEVESLLCGRLRSFSRSCIHFCRRPMTLLVILQLSQRLNCVSGTRAKSHDSNSGTKMPLANPQALRNREPCFSARAS